jgi:hypothetical protein
MASLKRQRRERGERKWEKVTIKEAPIKHHLSKLSTPC